MRGRFLVALVLIQLCVRSGPLSANLAESQSSQRHAAARSFYPLSFQYRREIYNRMNSDLLLDSALVSKNPIMLGKPEQPAEPALLSPFDGATLYQLKRLLL